MKNHKFTCKYCATICDFTPNATMPHPVVKGVPNTEYYIGKMTCPRCNARFTLGVHQSMFKA